MVIGVCLSELHNYLNTGYIAELDRAARAVDSELIVFNTSLDFTWYRKGSPVVRSIYRAIHYELFSALIVIAHSFHDDELFDEIVRNARARGIPVISVGAPHEGCHNIVNDPGSAFRDLLRHVIRDHGARDTFFMAGTRGEENSEFRLRCYQEVLEEFGLPFGEENMDWGNYWAQPASAITLRLIQERKTLPRAIFCANDVMAVAVCDTLKSNGIRVPEDVIVTGFDGIPTSYMVSPRLATISDNQAELADQTMDLICRLVRGEAVEETLTHPFQPVFSESCGCPPVFRGQFDTLKLFRMMENEHMHENQLYHAVERMLMQTEKDDFFRVLSHAIPANAAIHLNKSFLGLYQGRDYSSEEVEEDMLRIAHSGAGELPSLQDIQLFHNSPVSPIRTGVTLVNAIHSDSDVFGYFSAQTQDLWNDSQLLKRLSDVLNLIFTIHLGNQRQRNLMTHIEQNLYRDSLTGLSNLKGLTQWYEGFAADPENHRNCVSLSVYDISRYSYIYETYGIEETESVVLRVSKALIQANPEARRLARINDTQFVVFDSASTMSLLSHKIDTTVDEFYGILNRYNAENDRDYFVEINAGCTTMDAGWSSVRLENLIRLAAGEMYLNRLKAKNHEAVKDTQITAELYSTFSLLMEKNLFRYHFQPIVDAKTGLIYAYEALMRTDSLINLNPLQILAIAREYNRLYDVEKTTLFGIMERYVRDYDSFQGAKVFINTIPGHFLTSRDCSGLMERFGNYLDCFVFELTEQDSTSDDELQRLKRMCKVGTQTQIAIDDYGTGHSNMVNVLRYAPQIIKIDRELISGIESDSNKQLFVRNTITFAHQNGIRALAEGVETEEELKTVIGYGIDLIQGFFTARPTEQPVREINETIRQIITDENLRLARYDNDMQAYAARDGEVINLFDLALHQFTFLDIPEGTVTLKGQTGSSMDMVVRVAAGARTTLILEDIVLKGLEEPTIQLGSSSEVTLDIRGACFLRKDGIRVPGNASLTLKGGGDLFIDSSRNYSVGIGGNFNDSYGTILIDLEGHLEIHSSGDRIVCIGGSRSGGRGIILRRGDCTLSGSGINVLGMGSTGGNAEIRLENGRIACHMQGNDAVGFGTLSGHALIESAAVLEVVLDSERAIGIGTLSGTMDVRLTGGSAKVTIHCDAGSCFGNLTGEGISRFRGAEVHAHGEGNRVVGFGSVDGACDTRIESGVVGGEVLAARRQLLGNENSRVVITGGNIRLYPEDGQMPVSPDGTPLYLFNPTEDIFEKTFKDRRATWQYKAKRTPDGHLDVWILPQ